MPDTCVFHCIFGFLKNPVVIWKFENLKSSKQQGSVTHPSHTESHRRKDTDGIFVHLIKKWRIDGGMSIQGSQFT